jgi:hypothetical protein
MLHATRGGSTLHSTNSGTNKDPLGTDEPLRACSRHLHLIDAPDVADVGALEACPCRLAALAAWARTSVGPISSGRICLCTVRPIGCRRGAAQCRHAAAQCCYLGACMQDSNTAEVGVCFGPCNGSLIVLAPIISVCRSQQCHYCGWLGMCCKFEVGTPPSMVHSVALSPAGGGGGR